MKNVSYKNTYEIVVSGKTTNGFASLIIDSVMIAFFQTLEDNYKQTNVRIKVI